MGLVFVLLFWAAATTVVATVGAVILGLATGLLTRGVNVGRRRVIITASLFPYICLVWGGGVFVFQGLVNELLLHRDLGLGDTWHAPLPNGYQIMMIDVTDQGWVYNPKTQNVSGAVGEREDAVPGVRSLQVSGPYIFAASDSKAFDDLGTDSTHVDVYALLDTRTGKRTQFQDYNTLHDKALALGVQLDLQPIYSVYSKYRFSWFDVFAGLLFCAPPIIGGFLLIRWILRLRRMRAPQPHIV